jgi:hypothetical protein
MPQPVGIPAGTLHSKVLIERVIILGLPTNKGYTATAGKSKSFAVEAGVGVDVRLAQGSAVVVRAVNLPLAADWSLKISQGVAAA